MKTKKDILWRFIDNTGRVLVWTVQHELRDRALRRDRSRYRRAMQLHSRVLALDDAGAPDAVVARAEAAARRAARDLERRLEAAQARARPCAVIPAASRIVRRAARAPHVVRRRSETTSGGSSGDSEGDPPPSRVLTAVIVREPSAAERTRRRRVLSSSAEPSWDTPEYLLELVRRVGPIGLDPCASPTSVVGARVEWRLDRDGDSLARAWAPVLAEDELVYVNPPFGLALRRWMRHVAAQHHAGAELVVLTPARTDTRWWHDHVFRVAAAIAYLRGRVRFRGARNVAPFPVAISLFSTSPERIRAFAAAFGEVGTVVVRQLDTPTAIRSGVISPSCARADRTPVAGDPQVPDLSRLRIWTGSCDRGGAR